MATGAKDTPPSKRRRRAAAREAGDAPRPFPRLDAEAAAALPLPESLERLHRWGVALLSVCGSLRRRGVAIKFDKVRGAVEQMSGVDATRSPFTFEQLRFVVAAAPGLVSLSLAPLAANNGGDAAAAPDEPSRFNIDVPLPGRGAPLSADFVLGKARELRRALLARVWARHERFLLARGLRDEFAASAKVAAWHPLFDLSVEGEACAAELSMAPLPTPTAPAGAHADPLLDFAAEAEQPEAPRWPKPLSSRARWELYERAFDAPQEPQLSPPSLPPPQPPPPPPSLPPRPEQPLGERIAAFLERIKEHKFYAGQIAHVHTRPARTARYSRPRCQLAHEIEAQVAALGIDFARLFVHQARAVESAVAGHNVMLATPTSSGKSLAYYLAAAQHLWADPHARVLVMFPTKALAQDQLRALRKFFGGLRLRDGSPVLCDTYDGDTPATHRGEVLASAHVLLSNPDMLHVGLLPNHPRAGSALFARLAMVVLDEAHVYHGCFGTHVALVLRRLRRVCALYGSRPQFFLCSGTVGNPGPLAEALLGLPVDVVDEDGSPSGQKSFVFWNPPLLQPRAAASAGLSAARAPSGGGDGSSGDGSDSGEATQAASVPGDWRGWRDQRVLTKRRSALYEMGVVVSELVKAGLSTLAFCRIRKVCELVLCYVHQQLRSSENAADRALVGRVRSYRGGYSVAERRAIERELFQGALLGVVATNALELGVDIGTLDATVHLGFPVSVASLWQQAGRSGRKERDSLSILVAYDTPMDQHAVRHPALLMDGRHESVSIAPTNPNLLRKHLLCAAHEQPLQHALDAAFFGDVQALVGDMLRRRWLMPMPARTAAAAGALAPRASSSSQQPSAPSRLIVQALTPAPAPAPAPAPEAASSACYLLVPGSWREVYRRERRGTTTRYGKEDMALYEPFARCAADEGLDDACFSPAEDFSIRTAEENPYRVVDKRTGALLDEIEETNVFFEAFPGAVYLQQGRTFIVESVDMGERVAVARPANVNYHTKCMDVTKARVIHVQWSFPMRLLKNRARELDVEFGGWRHVAQGHGAAASPFSHVEQPYDPIDVLESAGGSGANARPRPEMREPASPPRRRMVTFDSATLATSHAPDASFDRALRAVESAVASAEADESASATQAQPVVYDAAEGPPLIDLTAAVPRVLLQPGAPTRDPTQWHKWPILKFGRAHVATQVYGFHRVLNRTNTILETLLQELPAASMLTHAVWVDIPVEAKREMEARGLDVKASVHAAAHCLIEMVPAVLPDCDGREGFDTECISPLEKRPRALRILLYDRHPGGLGLAALAYPKLPLLLAAALDVVLECPCGVDTGCAGCVQTALCHEQNIVLSKRGAAYLLSRLLNVDPRAPRGAPEF